MAQEDCFDGPTDPVHFDPSTSKWYFWDETWADKFGPFNTEEEAKKECVKYGNSIS